LVTVVSRSFELERVSRVQKLGTGHGPEGRGEEGKEQGDWPIVRGESTKSHKKRIEGGKEFRRVNAFT